ncbi:MAG: glycoside hydrolase family 38 C-terminal domain-containing protein [Dethiobacteria bacterium]|jgi:alpha-mannosidase|nr:hypothetical protein [Bacillota bacterium]HOP69741.1 glycoside hydrolase family 38 C-terminal domain-containing protein [Bacillota bacterium]HPT34628.1 glycoside hydrolase family 38 C-terminal domain-containing protein [Bacillota bacterium]
MRVFIVPHSHWDREWYLTFQQFRFKLVKLVDQVLEILERDPDFKYFTLDGQAIVLEDYLEIKPEARPRIEKLVREGRLLIGPWYILPDEFLVSGESLLRNLKKGMELCASFGKTMMVGYVPDQFGHIAQLPQIFQGCGLDTAVLWRGVGTQSRDAQFTWEAPDGSSVLTIYLVDSYSNGAALPTDAQALAEYIPELLERQRPFLSAKALLLMNGADHFMPQPELPGILEEAGKLADMKLEISSLPLYIEHIKNSSPRFSHLRGELRSGERAPLLVSCSSSRLHQKRRNHDLEILLEKYAEPLSAWSWLQGEPYPGGFLRECWRQLLMNQPHDSICGCSNDQVHREMESRYDQGEQIATLVREESLARLGGHIDSSWFPGEAGLLVFNPHPQSVTALVEAELPDMGEAVVTALADEKGRIIPWQPLGSGSDVYLNAILSPLQVKAAMGLISGREFQGLYLNGVKISGPDQEGLLKIDLIMGNSPVGELDLEAWKEKARKKLGEKGVKKVLVVARQGVERGLFLARDLPGCGWRGYIPAGSGSPPPPPTDLKVSTGELENSFYRITFNSDGTLNLLDKETGRVLPNLHRLVDGGDRGDLYTFTAPEKDTLVDSPVRGLKKVRFEVTETGPVRASVRITRTYRLPASLSPTRESRSRKKVDCRITTIVSLISNWPGVHFETVIDNRALDHRLRVHFSAPFKVAECHADGHFSVIRRSIQPPPGDYSGWAEKPDGLAPQKQFVSIDNGEFGLALINRGLPEYEVMTGKGSRGSEIALTLLRSVGWLSRDDLHNRPGHAGPAVETPEGQCLGLHKCSYTLVPHRGSWQEAKIKKLAGLINAPPVSTITGRKEGRLPAKHSLLTLEPEEMELSCIKKADDGEALIARFFNCSPEEQEAVVKTGFAYREALPANLLEEPVGAPLPASPEGVRVRLRPWQIFSLRFEI